MGIALMVSSTRAESTGTSYRIAVLQGLLARPFYKYSVAMFSPELARALPYLLCHFGTRLSAKKQLETAGNGRQHG